MWCCAPSSHKVEQPNFTRGGAGAPLPVPVPPILEAFLEARRLGDVQSACDCCSDDITLRGPMGEFVGIEAVKTKAFNKASQPPVKTLMPLLFQPHLSSPNESVFAREFEAQVRTRPPKTRAHTRAPQCRRAEPPRRADGRNSWRDDAAGKKTDTVNMLCPRSCASACAQIGYARVPLRQEFTVRNADKPHCRVSLVVFSKLAIM